jgi:nucleotide-binding universal stress UspA family protein
MYKKILVPVDGSRASNRGLREAIRLARDQKASLQLLHIIDDLVFTPSFGAAVYADQLLDALREASRRVLQRADATARRHGIKPNAVMLDSLGERAGDLIVRQAKKWHADLIVIGTHGHRGLGRLVLGSDAESVVRAAPVPVLLVRAKPSSRKPGARRKSG